MIPNNKLTRLENQLVEAAYLPKLKASSSLDRKFRKPPFWTTFAKMIKYGESSSGPAVYQTESQRQCSNLSLPTTEDSSYRNSTELQFIPLRPPPNNQILKVRDPLEVEGKGKQPVRNWDVPRSDTDVESQGNNYNPTSINRSGSTDEFSTSNSWFSMFKTPVVREADRLFTWRVNCFIIPVAGFSSLAQVTCLPFLLVYTLVDKPDARKAFNTSVAGTILGGLILVVLGFKRALFWLKKVDQQEGATKSRWEILMVVNSLISFVWLWCLYFLLGLRTTAERAISRSNINHLDPEQLMKP
ncbi:hypothetical protein TWF225_009761 [Orbilia oligospora]|nr:hypothetical protein TWF225_009761 [Orbilia oligospora]KAF3239576.1 hypothetical protein TWF217_001245 [Orbilia oligospora]KAF3261219.1 hypothetical protein TWF128_003014 [Orbilia oligospora]